MLNTTSLNNYSETKYIIFRTKVSSFFFFWLVRWFVGGFDFFSQGGGNN